MTSERKHDVEEDSMSTPTVKHIEVEYVTRSGRVQKKPAKFVREVEKIVEKKRWPTGYLLWVRVNRAQVVADNPGIDFGTISKKMGEMWSAMPEREKMIWKRKAKKAARKESKLITTGKATAQKMVPLPQPTSVGYSVLSQHDISTVTAAPNLTTKQLRAKQKSKKIVEDQMGLLAKKQVCGLTLYLLWIRANRARIAADNPGIDFGTISKKMGDMWSSLSDREKMDQYGGASDLSAADEGVVDTGAGPDPLGMTQDCNTLMSLKYVKTETGGRKCIKCLHEFTGVDEFEAHLAACFCEDCSNPQENVGNERLKFEPDSENVGMDNGDTFGFITMNSDIKQEPGVEKLTSRYIGEFEGTGSYSEDNFDATGDFRIEQNFEVNESVTDNPDGSVHDLDDFEIKVKPVVDDTEGSMHDPDDFEIKVEVDEDAVTDDLCEKGESGENSAGSRFQNVSVSVEGTMSKISGRKLETNVYDTSSECSMRRDDCDIKIEPVTDGPDSSMHGPDNSMHGPDSSMHGPDNSVHGPDSSMHGPDSSIHGLNNSMHDLNNSVHDLNDSMRDTDDCDIKMEVIEGVADYRNKFDEETTGDSTHDDVSDHEMEADIASYTQTTFHDAAGTDGGTGEFELNDIKTQITKENHSLQITGVFCNKRILNNRPVGAKTKSLALVCPRCRVLFNSHDTLAMHACMI